MTDKDGFPQMPFRLSRRQLISGMASAGVLMGGPVNNAFGQAPHCRHLPAMPLRLRSVQGVDAMTASAKA